MGGFTDDVLGFDPGGGGIYGAARDVLGDTIADDVLGMDPNGGGFVGAYNVIGPMALAALGIPAGLEALGLGGTGSLSSLFGGAGAAEGAGGALAGGGSAALGGAELAGGATGLGEATGLGSAMTPAATSFATGAAVPAGELVSGMSGIAPNLTTGAGMSSIFDVAPGAVDLGSGIGSTASSMGGLGTGYNLGAGFDTLGSFAPNIGNTAAGLASTYAPSTMQNIMGAIGNIPGSMLDYAKKNPLGTLKGLGSIFGAGEANRNRQQMQDYASRQQQFQDKLAETYKNPGSYLNTPEAQATRSRAAQEVARAAAASGRRSDVGAQMRDLNAMMLSKALPAYRQDLIRAYNPQMQLQAQRYGQAQSPTGNIMAGLGSIFGGNNSSLSDLASLAQLFGR